MSEPIESWPKIEYKKSSFIGQTFVKTINPPDDIKIYFRKNIKTLTFEKEGGKKITIPVDKFLNALEALK